LVVKDVRFAQELKKLVLNEPVQEARPRQPQFVSGLLAFTVHLSLFVYALLRPFVPNIRKEKSHKMFLSTQKEDRVRDHARRGKI
jgi:hypothetical protein